jgi:tetratricopeptide (TPR) repeat protein
MPIRSIRIQAMPALRHILIITLLLVATVCPTTASQMKDEEFEDAYDTAWHHYNTGEVEKALELFLEMQKRYPGDSKLYLTLGTVYLELGDYERAKDELRNALLSDPPKDVKIWANIRLGMILLKDGALEAAERHFKSAVIKGTDSKALFEIARGLHRVNIQHFLEGRYKSGRYLIHYFPFGAIKKDDLKWLVSRLKGSYQLCNDVLKVKGDFPIEVYVYPNVQSFINFFGEGAPTVYPEYNEIHEIIDKDYDYLEALCPLMLYWLQVELNRHGTNDFIYQAVPHLIRGEILGIDLQTYVYALIERDYFVDLKVLRHQSFYPMVDRGISGPEAASFIAFLMSEYDTVDISLFLTQPNLEALYGMDVITAQREWLAWIEEGQRLDEWVEDEIGSVLSYVKKFELAAYIPEEVMEWFKRGLELVGEGYVKEGEKEIKRVVEAYPNFGLAYYALGRLEFDRGDYDKSREYFERALEALTPYGRSWGWTHYNLGHICEVDEDYTNAMMHYERALESDVPNEVRIVGSEKISTLAKVADIAPAPGAESEPDDLRDAVDLFSFIDLGLLNDRMEDMRPYFATELNEASYTQFASAYEEMMAPFSTPIVMHQVAGVESIGDFVRVKVILKLEVPESEHSGITQFEEYLKLRRGKLRYFLLLRTEIGLKIVEFVDAPSLAGRAKVLEEGGEVIPFEGG